MWDSEFGSMTVQYGIWGYGKPNTESGGSVAHTSALIAMQRWQSVSCASAGCKEIARLEYKLYSTRDAHGAVRNTV